MTELSLYEQRNDLTTVAKSWFVELFQGDALDTDRWDLTEDGGANSAMADKINGGYQLKTGTTSLDASFIDFNNINQYTHNSSALIGVISFSL